MILELYLGSYEGNVHSFQVLQPTHSEAHVVKKGTQKHDSPVRSMA